MWFFKKKTVRQEEPKIKKEKELNKAIYMEISKLITDDDSILSNLSLCFQNPKLYFEKNIERYSYRIESEENTDQVAWFAIVDELIDGGIAVELDWKEALNEFVSRMKELADNNNLHIEAAWFDENEDIPVWCKVIDEKWERQGFCVGAIDIDSDSYVMFICKIEILKKLIILSKEINHRFDFAKNM